MASKLAEYQRKRRFDASPEPAGKRGAQARPRHDPEGELHFVVQEHHARGACITTSASNSTAC